MAIESSYIHGTSREEQERLSEPNRLTNGSFLEFLAVRPGDAVLEVGSGVGILAHQVALAHPRSNVTGVEISEEQLRKALEELSEEPNLSFVRGDAMSLEFAQASFDVVYCRYLLEHVADPSGALSEMFRVLKPGGRGYVQENNIAINVLYPECPVFTSVWKEFAGLQAKLGGDAEVGKKLYFLMKSLGFESVRLSIAPEIHYAGSPAFVPWVTNLIGNIRGAKERLAKLQGVAEEVVEQAIAELNDFKSNPLASAYFYWNRASARKL